MLEKHEDIKRKRISNPVKADLNETCRKRALRLVMTSSFIGIGMGAKESVSILINVIKRQWLVILLTLVVIVIIEQSVLQYKLKSMKFEGMIIEVI